MNGDGRSILNEHLRNFEDATANTKDCDRMLEVIREVKSEIAHCASDLESQADQVRLDRLQRTEVALLDWQAVRHDIENASEQGDIDEVCDEIERIAPHLEGWVGYRPLIGKIRQAENRRSVLPERQKMPSQFLLAARMNELERSAPNCHAGHPMTITRSHNGRYFWGCSEFSAEEPSDRCYFKHTMRRRDQDYLEGFIDRDQWLGAEVSRDERNGNRDGQDVNVDLPIGFVRFENASLREVYERCHDLYPSHLAFIQCGCFWECYEEDAERCLTLLDWNVSPRHGMKMTGTHLDNDSFVNKLRELNESHLFVAQVEYGAPGENAARAIIQVWPEVKQSI